MVCLQILAFLGTFFDPDFQHLPHTQILQQMSDVDRSAALTLMNKLKTNLIRHADLFRRHTEQVAHELHHSGSGAM